MVQNNDTGDFAVPTKTCGHGHMQLRRVKVGQVVEAESGLVAVNAFYLLISIPGPESPERKVGMFRRREQPQPVDAAVLANPVSHGGGPASSGSE